MIVLKFSRIFSSLLILFLVILLIFQLNQIINKTELIVNPHDYKILINSASSICNHNKGENILLVALVEVSPTAFKERKIIRETWGNKNLFKLTRVVFLIGFSKNEAINKILIEENQRFNDIVQEDFIDSYKNLTIKTIMGFKWVTEYCPKAKFALKTDDDVVINTPILERYLESVSEKDLYMGYYLISPNVIRNKASKFYASESEFNLSHYNSYQLGVGYFVSLDLARKLFEMSLQTPLFKFEDVYIGMLAKKLNIKGKQIAKLYFMNNIKSVKHAARLTSDNNTILLAYATRNNFLQIWNYFYNLSFSDTYIIEN